MQREDMASVDTGLDGRIALVTGAARGLGLAIATAFHAQGARIVLFDLDRPTDADTGYELSVREDLEAVAAALGPDVLAVTGSVTDEADLARAISESESVLGRAPDIAVANAGLGVVQDTWDMSEAAWELIHGVNLKGAWMTCRAVIPAMRARSEGRLILVSSNVALRPQRNSGAPAYTSSKAGVIGLAKALAADLGADGITVNALLPGVVPTKMNEDFDLKPWRNQVLSRSITAEDIAAGAVYLASTQAAGITGLTLAIDGGYSTV